VGEVAPPPPPPSLPWGFREVSARPRGDPSGDCANSRGGRWALVGGFKMRQCHSSIHDQ